MAARKADARWEGTLKEGKGTLTLGSGAYEGQYSFSSRFEEGPGTNPEELIGAAHAGCFAMALNAALERADMTPNFVHATANVKMERKNDVPTITKIELSVEASVPGIDADKFQEFAEDAKANCIISRALGGVEEITLDAKLV
jgi:lipoyl-dependent peroxiredoxin